MILSYLHIFTGLGCEIEELFLSLYSLPFQLFNHTLLKCTFVSQAFRLRFEEQVFPFYRDCQVLIYCVDFGFSQLMKTRSQAAESLSRQSEQLLIHPLGELLNTMAC